MDITRNENETDYSKSLNDYKGLYEHALEEQDIGQTLPTSAMMDEEEHKPITYH